MVRAGVAISVSMVLVWAVGCDEAPAVKKQSEAKPPAAASAETKEAASEKAESAGKAEPAAESLTGDLKLDAIQLTPPETWVRKPPRSEMIKAEFTLPKAEGDERDGRLTLMPAGGSVQDNIDRWRGQFGGKPDKESKDDVELSGVTVTVVDFTGTFSDQAGPFTPGVERPGYRMLGAIIPLPGEAYFIKAYGPEKTMAAHFEEFQAFVKTLKVTKKAE